MSFKKLPGPMAFKRIGGAFSYGRKVAVPGGGARALRCLTTARRSFSGTGRLASAQLLAADLPVTPESPKVRATTSSLVFELRKTLIIN